MNKSLYINYIDFFDKPHFTVNIDNNAGNKLFTLLKPLFEKTMADEEFWLEEYENAYQKVGFIEFDDLPNDVFMQTYEIIKKSDDKDLQPFVPEILQKMQADPRYIA